MSLVLHMLDTYQSQPNALMCADEVFCGRAPHRGTETCAVVESMASLEQAFAVLGTPALFDRVETLAFNAMPAALTADMWTHVYVQQANSVFAGKTGPAPSPPPAGSDEPSHHHHHHHHAEPHVHRHLHAGPPPPPSAECAHVLQKTAEGDGVAGAAGAAADGGKCAAKTDVGDTPSGEDLGSNYFGVSHFPCCASLALDPSISGWPCRCLLPGCPPAAHPEADGSRLATARQASPTFHRGGPSSRRAPSSPPPQRTHSSSRARCHSVRPFLRTSAAAPR
jgi:hypothetical protein